MIANSGEIFHFDDEQRRKSACRQRVGGGGILVGEGLIQMQKMLENLKKF